MANTMLVDYQDKVTDNLKFKNSFKDLEIDINEVIKKEQTAIRVGHIYPNLHSQLSYLKKDYDMARGNIVDIAEKLQQYDTFKNVANAIYNLVDNYEQQFKDFDDATPIYNELRKNIFELVEIVKIVDELNEQSDRLNDVFANLNLTKHGILL